MSKKKKIVKDEKCVFTHDMDENIKKGSATIAKILKNDPEGRYIRDLIEYHLKEIDYDTHDDLTMALALAFGADVGRTIAFPLFTNDPLMLAEYERLNIPDRVMIFLRYLVALYGAKAEHAALSLKHPGGLKQTMFDVDYDSSGKAHSITMKLIKVNNDSITIIDEPDSYLFLVYQILEQLSSIEPPDADTLMAEVFEKIEERVKSRIKDSAREYINE
ncbi:MAG: hypothetical protein J7J03_06590 [Methanosarcinales archaeon]|nr:hypothetical protein [Methanosarcinales archaeon]